MSNLTTEASNPTEITNLEEAIAAKIRELPREQQQQILDFAEFLLIKLQQPGPKIHNYQPGMSAYDVSQEFAGCLGDSPADLSTNSKYMEGLGM
jgi:hypothetical protein